MNYLNNKGSALVTALLIITLIFIFSSVLIFTALNSMKQNQITEKQIQATNMAEMAIMYFQEYVKSKIDSTENSVKAFQLVNPLATNEQLTQEFCTKFQLANISDIPITTDPLYKAEITNITIDRSNCNQIYVQFISKGIYNGSTKIINGSFNVKNNSTTTSGTGISTAFPMVPSTFTTTCSSLEDCDGQSNVISNGSTTVAKKETITIGGLYVNGNLDISTTHTNLIINNGNFYVNGMTTIGNQSTINVQNGNAYFKDISGLSNGIVTITGDGYIYGDVTRFKTNSGNQLFINITGTVYVSDSSDLPTNYADYCDRARLNGICAGSYKHISNAPANNPDLASPETAIVGWAIDEPSITTKYQ